MAFRSGLPPIQIFLLGRALSRGVLAWSVAIHAVAFAVAGWLTWQPAPPTFRAPPLEVTRQYATQYLVLPAVTPKAATQPERRPVSRPGPVAMVAVPEVIPASDPTSQIAGGQAPPAGATAILTVALPLDSIASVGAGALSADPNAPGGPNLLARLGFRVPGAGDRASGLDPRPGLADGDSASPGGTRVAELLTPDGTACPSLRRPPAWGQRDLTVSVAFVVDQRGFVDRRSLRVVQSPERPQTDYHYYPHIYAVSSTGRVDGKLRDVAAAYDSVVTDDVVSHVADLLFRPALRDGQPISSTVLVSCQSPVEARSNP